MPSKAKLGVAMAELGLAMVQLDLPGHGYSEGERAYITSYSHWLDDYFQVRVAKNGSMPSFSATTNLSMGPLLLYIATKKKWQNWCCHPCSSSFCAPQYEQDCVAPVAYDSWDCTCNSDTY